MEDIKIIVAYHKPNTYILNNSIYVPVYTKETNGINLSKYESYLNELCALYWYWKNTPDLPELIGMQLYRRFFVFNYQKIYNIKSSKIPTEKELMLDKIDYSVDMHLPVPLKVNSVYYQYMGDFHHDKQIMNYCMQLIPDCKTYLNQQELFYSNMFILRKDLFLEYCNWLFDIIFKILKYYNNNPRSRCYISERLTGIWLYNHKDKCNTKVIPTITVNKTRF
jgi:hypothetical protein